MSAHELTAQRIAQELARGRALARSAAGRAAVVLALETLLWTGLAAAATVAIIGF